MAIHGLELVASTPSYPKIWHIFVDPVHLYIQPMVSKAQLPTFSKKKKGGGGLLLSLLKLKHTKVYPTLALTVKNVDVASANFTERISLRARTWW